MKPRAVRPTKYAGVNIQLTTMCRHYLQFLEWKITIILLKISEEFNWKYINISTVVPWYREDERLLPETMMTQFANAQAAMKIFSPVPVIYLVTTRQEKIKDVTYVMSARTGYALETFESHFINFHGNKSSFCYDIYICVTLFLYNMFSFEVE